MIIFQHIKNTSKTSKKRCFLRGLKNVKKRPKKAKNGPNPKTVRGVSWYPQNRHFSSKLHSGKTPKSRKIGQKSPFFRGPKTPKNRHFLDLFFDIIIILIIIITKNFYNQRLIDITVSKLSYASYRC